VEFFDFDFRILTLLFIHNYTFKAKKINFKFDTELKGHLKMLIEMKN